MILPQVDIVMSRESCHFQFWEVLRHGIKIGMVVWDKTTCTCVASPNFGNHFYIAHANGEIDFPSLPDAIAKLLVVWQLEKLLELEPNGT